MPHHVFPRAGRNTLCTALPISHGSQIEKLRRKLRPSNTPGRAWLPVLVRAPQHTMSSSYFSNPGHPPRSAQAAKDDYVIYIIISNLCWTLSLLHNDALPRWKIAIGFHSHDHSAPVRQRTTIFNEIGLSWFSPLFSISPDRSPCKSLPVHALLSHSVLFLYPEGQYPAKCHLFKILKCTNLAQKLGQRASPWLLQLGGIFPPQSPRSIYISSFKLQNKMNSSC